MILKNLKKYRTILTLREVTPFLFLFFLIDRLFGPSIYRMNDDAFMSWLIAGQESAGMSDITVYTGSYYGKFLSFLTKNFQNIEWFGISQIISLGLFLSVLTILLEINFTDQITKIVMKTVLYVYFAWYLLSPTYTMTSIALAFISFIIFYQISLESKTKNIVLFFLVSSFGQIISWSFRPDGFYMAILLSMPLIIIFIAQKSRKSLIFILLSINIALVGIFIALDEMALDRSISKSKAWQKYYEFNSAYSTIKTNPAELVMYQEVIDGKIPEIRWNKVDTLIFQTNSFYDDVIFSGANLKVGVERVENDLGVKGIVKRGFESGFLRTVDYLKDSIYFLVVLFLVFFGVFLLRTKILFKVLFSLAYLLPVLAIFFYLGAGYRLPARVTLPALVFLIFIAVYLLYEKLASQQRLKYYFNFTSLMLIFIFLVGPNNIFDTSEKNRLTYNNMKINLSVMQKFGSDAVFVGSIEAFPENSYFAYRNNSYGEIKYLTSGWFSFSPIWYQKLFDLDLLNDDPYLALAQQSNVFWVSDSFRANMVNIYMNDRQILRKNLCRVANLSGNLGVYTFQSAVKCEN